MESISPSWNSGVSERTVRPLRSRRVLIHETMSFTKESRVIDEVVDAATDLARHRIGALITFEQDANLDEFVGVHKGHVVDAQITKELLVSLFIPEAVNKLHDGSVIIRNFRIAAGQTLPSAVRKGARQAWRR